MEQLKPCPFCGGKASLNIDPDGTVDTEGRRWAFTIVCNKCAATAGLHWLVQNAIEAWNRRAYEKQAD